jgi:hypothetical protein
MLLATESASAREVDAWGGSNILPLPGEGEGMEDEVERD